MKIRQGCRYNSSSNDGSDDLRGSRGSTSSGDSSCDNNNSNGNNRLTLRVASFSELRGTKDESHWLATSWRI